MKNPIDELLEERDELKLTVEGVKEELRELGVAYEKLQEAAKVAAESIRNLKFVPMRDLEDSNELIASLLEGAAGVAK